MALNKQRILSELGSVVNQLQSAECGCMGKLFSDPGQGSSIDTPPMQSCGGCRTGCCHGRGSYSGEPCSVTNNQYMHRPFLGNCNPPKLYADTYNYLNKNLMQPLVNEVYNDLKTISPDNTIMNDPMASKMGLSPMNPAMTGQHGQENMGMGNTNASPQMGHHNQYVGQIGQTMGQIRQPMGQMSRPTGQMSQIGGMGSQIMKMMMSDKSSKPANMPVQNDHLTDSMLINAPQSPHGQVEVTALNPPNYGAHSTTHNMNYEQDMIGPYAQNPSTQPMSHSNAYSENPMANPIPQRMFQNNTQQNNLPSNIMTQNYMNTNPGVMTQNKPMGSGSQPMAPNSYGQHTQGVKKFSEMFPGVMQGDLGFDPMAIAIQMNPANQQQAALSSMEKLMNGNKVMNTAKVSNMQPVINAANVASASIGQSDAAFSQQSGVHSTAVANQPFTQSQAALQNNGQPQQQQQQQVVDARPPFNQVPQQQVYTATKAQEQHSPNKQFQQQPWQFQIQQQCRPQTQQQIIDPSTPNHGTGYEQVLDQNAQMQQGETFQQMIMDPILPADTKNRAVYSNHVKHLKNYNYNTLGQPVQMLDAKMYHPAEPPLPQTLSPQSTVSKPKNVLQTYSNVKNTVSKTAIIGNGTMGRTPSINRLQHLYNQYKGSHSFTQQNINAPVQHHSQSEGRLNENVNTVRPRPVHVEKLGGDTANNVVANQDMNKLERPASVPMGDVVPTNKLQGDGLTEKAPPIGTFRGRNGLQDVVFTSGPTSAAWSFHGNSRAPHAYSTGYRFRAKVK